jgi:hypothetical protein
MHLGGVNSATPDAVTYEGVDGLGTDIAGAAINIAGGQGTGAGEGGDIVLQGSQAGGTATRPATSSGAGCRGMTSI